MRQADPVDKRHTPTLECVYCGRRVPDLVVPTVGDDREWERMGREHREDCEWVRTRAHHLMKNAKSRDQDIELKPKNLGLRHSRWD